MPVPSARSSCTISTIPSSATVGDGMGDRSTLESVERDGSWAKTVWVGRRTGTNRIRAATAPIHRLAQRHRVLLHGRWIIGDSPRLKQVERSRSFGNPAIPPEAGSVALRPPITRGLRYREEIN